MKNKNNNYGFLCDINDSRLGVRLDGALRNNNVFVVAANGKVNDFDLLSRLYVIEECALNDHNFNGNIKENYFDDGKMFCASLSFIRKD